VSKLTKKGAQSVTADLDRLANLFQADHKTLGIPAKIAMDFAYRADLLSDTIEKAAGIEREAMTVVPEDGFNPDEIGAEEGGPLQMESDEPYMQGQFSEQENRELRDMQEGGGLSSPNEDPRSPSPGKQADFESFGRQAAASYLDTAGVQLNAAASENPQHAAGLTRLASQVLNVKAGVLEGKVASEHVARTLKAVRQLLPHVQAAGEEEKVTKLVSLASKVAAGAPRQAQEAHGYNLSA
jgi:hypothetical protein